MSPLTLKNISECFIKPKHEVEESKQPYYLSPWDLFLLPVHYNQKGLLFAKPNTDHFSIESLLESLKKSLELTLVHFYPLVGQLVTKIDEDQQRCLVYVNCNKGHGVRFVHASVDMSISDIRSPIYDPNIVKSFFDHSDGEVNYDGHTRPLLTVQVTELVDGIFIGCSMNHVLVDGTSFWHFWNIWSKIHRANGESVAISGLPVHKRFVPDGYRLEDTYLPLTSCATISRLYLPQVKERFFHFSAETIANLKAKANEEANNSDIKISSFQALAAFVWRAIIRAKGLAGHKVACCLLAVNERKRVEPPLPEEYFGNSLNVLKPTTTVSELLEHSLGWTAALVHQSIVNHTAADAYDFFHGWFKSPYILHTDKMVEDGVDRLQFGSSPRFNIYGNEFLTLGKPLAVRSGISNKFEGKVIVYPGYEGGGSMDLEICLSADHMSRLEADHELMDAISLPNRS